MLWRARYCRRFANHQITKNREIPDLVRTLDQGTDPESRNREKVTCLGRAPDSQIRGPDHESRNREIAKKSMSCPDTGLPDPWSGSRIAKSRNREIAKSRKKSHVLAAKSRKSHMSWPGSGLPDQGSGSRIAKSRNREIAKKSHVLAGLRTPRSGVRIPNRESMKSRKALPSPSTRSMVPIPDREIAKS